MSTCGVTETLYGNQVKGVVSQEYGVGYDPAKDFVKVPTMKGGAPCPCSAGVKPTMPAKPQMQLGGAGTCTGGTPMLKALGIMAGGKRRGNKRSGEKRKHTKRAAATAACKCRPFSGGRSGSKRSRGYKPTARNLATLRKYKAGKSIGFTARSSLKAKGLIPRSNGRYKVSRKYK